MFIIVKSLTIILIFIFLGYFLRKTKIISSLFLNQAEKILYYIAFPVLIILVLWSTPFKEDTLSTMLILLPLCQILMGFLTVCLSPLIKEKKSTFASYFQTAVRYNNFIALNLATFLLSEVGFSLMNVASLVLIPTANILSISGFLKWGNFFSLSVSVFFKSFFSNPLILSCLVGILFNVSHVVEPLDVFDLIPFYSKIILISSLIMVGAAMKFSLFFQAGLKIILFSMLRLLVMPLIAFALAVLFSLSPTLLTIMVIATATPTAPSGYILAKKMGGDSSTMAILIVTTTILSFFTLPLILFLFTQ